MFNTGTNLLCELVRSNFAGTHCVEYVWKHLRPSLIASASPPKDWWTRKEYGDTIPKDFGKKVLGLAMVRNPLSWLTSVQKAPYELVNCVGGSVSETLTKWC